MTSSAIIFSLTQKIQKYKKRRIPFKTKKAFIDAARYSACTLGCKNEQELLLSRSQRQRGTKS
jgi:hypothetical protein